MALALDEHIEAFVSELTHKGAFTAPWLEDALRGVPRHCFLQQYYDGEGNAVRVVPGHPTDEQLKLIYSDSVLMIRKTPNYSAASQPCLVMWMLGDMDIKRGQKVLEIGTGSGWNAGLLAFGVGDGHLVYSMDVQPDLVEEAAAHLLDAGIEGVNLRASDAGYGWSEAAPFDRITATVGCPDIPPAWHEQLAEGGILLVPLTTAGIGDPVIRLKKQNGRVKGSFSRWSWFVDLQGDYSTRTEELLLRPFEPWLATLLSESPRILPLPEVLSCDCLFFLRLKGLHFQGLHDGRDPRSLHGGYLHHESASVFFPDRNSPLLCIYGDSSLGETVAACQEEWVRLGRPTIMNYEVELVRQDAVESAGTWLDRRRHACLRFSLK